MKFNLIDRVESLTAERIVAVKTVSLAEEYLGDHFPTFPVLPGVMMLEAATQAAGWLLHHREGFSRSMAVLREARNVKYGNFVAPGRELRLEIDFVKNVPGGNVSGGNVPGGDMSGGHVPAGHAPGGGVSGADVPGGEVSGGGVPGGHVLDGAVFKVVGKVGGATAIAARIELSYFDLGGRNADWAALDERMREFNKQRWALLAPAETTVHLTA